MTLDEIAIKHGTDKATKHPVIAGHGYAPFYESLFHPIREDPIKMLEIGVGGGESIRTWLEYFPKAKVFGVDNNPDAFHESDERYTFVQGDQSSEPFWLSFAEQHGGAWDIIIDDGSHVSTHIITTFKAMWRHVNYGGFYCIEDLGVSFGPPGFFVPAGQHSHMDFLRPKADEVVRGSDIHEMHLFRELCIFRKFPIPNQP